MFSWRKFRASLQKGDRGCAVNDGPGMEDLLLAYASQEPILLLVSTGINDKEEFLVEFQVHRLIMISETPPSLQIVRGIITSANDKINRMFPLRYIDIIYVVGKKTNGGSMMFFNYKPRKKQRASRPKRS